MILDPILEMYADGERDIASYEAMLVSLVKRPDGDWVSRAKQAREDLWQLKLVDHPWRKMLVRDIGHWIRGKLKIEAHARDIDWREVRDEHGLGEWDNER